jgi:ATP-dependent RNA helicase DeaD
LAKQVAKDAKVLVGEDGPRVTAVYGGTKYGPQLDAFRKGAHLVVGTPGRILDHLIRGSLKLHELQILVFDEADRMLSMGFYPDMIDIQSFLPERDTDTFMFSATYPPRVMHLAHDFMDEPGFLSLSRDHVHVTDVNHVFYSVPPMDKDRSLVRVIELENPDSALIFCNTRARVHYVKVVLERFGYNADEISSDLSQRARERVMGKLKEGKLRFLVATDVAARGIDIPELSHVIQYEPPADIELYIHRAGRTGRAGASGEAVTLVGDFSEKVKLEKIERQYDIEFKERPLPSDEDVAGVVGERLLVELESQMRAYQEDQLKHKRMERFDALAKTLCENEDEMSLIAMLLDIYYQRSLGRPQTIPGRHDQKRQSKRRNRRNKRRKRRR